MPLEYEGIAKDTYVNSDERTYRALTYDMFSSLESKMDTMIDSETLQRGKCDSRFKELETCVD